MTSCDDANTTFIHNSREYKRQNTSTVAPNVAKVPSSIHIVKPIFTRAEETPNRISTIGVPGTIVAVISAFVDIFKPYRENEHEITFIKDT